jgi:hypothetical protein
MAAMSGMKDRKWLALPVVAALLLLSACPTPVKGVVETTVDVLEPPSWIIGTWVADDGSARWVFEYDEVVWTSSTGPIPFRSYAIAYPEVSVSDSSDGTSYSILLEEGGSSTLFYFQKIANDTKTACHRRASVS